ncbi:MAG: Uncharacterised protein [Flavobacterium sp. SCGC AAA160-P02]|nr:MAG: Uncharacterised protein [Flavobacterium sp. SCGC AAA160-P02]
MRLLTDSKSTGFYSSIGISYRLNRHVDKVTNLDENMNLTEDKGNYGERKKGFFGRLFSKAPSIFKKKGRKQLRKSSNLKKESIQSINENTDEDETIIKNDSSQTKQDQSIRVRPKRTRIKPSKIKIKKDRTQSDEPQTEETQNKESKKGLFGIFKKKTKKEKKLEKIKDTEKGAEQLEREIKKLEREIKKDELKRKKEQKRLEKKTKKKKKEKNDE